MFKNRSKNVPLSPDVFFVTGNTLLPEYLGVSIRGVKKPLGRVGVMSSQKNG